MLKTVRESLDVLVVGGGTAGHVAAISAACVGASVSVIEASSMLGGTMTDGGVLCPTIARAPRIRSCKASAERFFKRRKKIEGLGI